MIYKVERYKNQQRFNGQYEEIYRFLLRAADRGYNEHFHWGRFEWMMCHAWLDIDGLGKIALFRDENNGLAGFLTYDTCLEDSAYLIHSTDDKELLNRMVDFAEENYSICGKTVIKVNQCDAALNEVLRERGFIKKKKDNTVLEIGLKQDMVYNMPEGFYISPVDFETDNWSYQNVIHKGFDNEGIPEPWEEELFRPTPNHRKSLKVFALKEREYCAHCGVWYTQGETAYIEPVVTIPEFRKMGLAKAVVYEAITRAKKMGAKRAIVLSEQDFYDKIGFKVSSEIYCWEK